MGCGMCLGRSCEVPRTVRTALALGASVQTGVALRCSQQHQQEYQIINVMLNGHNFDCAFHLHKIE